MINDKKDRKKRRKIVTIGIILLVIGVICLIASISGLIASKKAYELELEEWHEQWWGNPDSSVSVFDQPRRNYLQLVPFILLSVMLIIASIVIILKGLLDVKTDECANELSGGVGTFSSSTIVNTQNSTEQKANVRRKNSCEFCGAKLDKHSTTCNYCGKENL